MGGIPSWAVKGARVVCIKNTPWMQMPRGIPTVDLGETRPVYGTVYTIRAVATNDSLWLEEIVNEPRLYADGIVEKSFHFSAFRPLITRTQEQDLEQFLPLLDPPLVKIPHLGTVRA